MISDKFLKLKNFAAAILICLSLFLLAGISLRYGCADNEVEEVHQAVVTVDGETVSDSLPFSSDSLPHGTEVTISLRLTFSRSHYCFPDCSDC